MGLTVMRNEQSAEKLMAPADCTGWHAAGALQPARRARYANVGAGPGEREEEKPAQRREMQMTGTEISAENPGLTAGAGARLSLTPSGPCQACRGVAARNSRLDLSPGRGWDAGKRSCEKPRTWREEAGSSMVVTSLEKVARRGAAVKEVMSGVGNAGVRLSPSGLLPYRQPEGLLQRRQRERRRGRESTWALDRPVT